MADQSKIENLYTVNCVKNDPAFSNYKADTVFQQYVKNVVAKYQAEHERVRQWLEESDML